MTSPNNLEIYGSLSEHPLAELLVEIRQIRLNGSLRLDNGKQKAIIYFDAGDVVFAVSNSRQHRLYELLLRENIVNKQQLLDIPDFTDDLALSKNLLKNDLLGHRSRTANCRQTRCGKLGFPKRAEGKLNRLLAIFPSNREAKALLDSLK